MIGRLVCHLMPITNFVMGGPPGPTPHTGGPPFFPGSKLHKLQGFIKYIMSTKQSKAKKKVVAPNESGEEEEDLGALIYREGQLRKAEGPLPPRAIRRHQLLRHQHHVELQLGSDDSLLTRAKNRCLFHNAKMLRK